MNVCEAPDTFYPLIADIYYPIIEQGAYGDVQRQWMLDATIACFFAPASRKAKQDVEPQRVNITIDNSLVGRTRNDIRFTSLQAANSMTNIIITNIRDRHGVPIYVETSGPRAGKSTLFEIATNEPIVGAFGKVEYYKVVIRRSENQAVTV
jgi:hypothetical protein